MREYEILIIVKPTAGSDKAKQLAEKVQAWIKADGGDIFYAKDHGLRDLASEMQRVSQGYYFQYQFTSTPESLKEIQTNLGVNEDIFRYMIVRIDEVRKNEPLGAPTKEFAKERDAVEA